MCTVAELKQYLSTLPDNAIVEVLKEVDRGYSTCTAFYPVDLHPHGDTTVFDCEGITYVALASK